MLRLVILRHAHSEPAGAGGDRKRRLSSRGHEQCEDVLNHMRENGIVPEVVVCSTAARTRETWQRIAAAAPDARLDLHDALYSGGPDAYEDAIAAANADGTVLVVGHNPTCAALALSCRDARDLDPMLAQGRYPTGSLLVAEMHERARVATHFFTPPRRDAAGD